MKKLLILMVTTGVMMGACTPKASGPESDNPLLATWNTPFGVPPFDLVKVEHYKPAFMEAMAQHNAEIDAIVNSKKKPTFENTIVAYDKAGALMSKVRPVFSAVNSGNATPEILAISKEMTTIFSAHSDNIRLNPVLFQKVKAVYDQRANLKLTPEQLRLLTEMYDGFKRSGAELPADKQEILKELNSKISALQVQFSQSLLAETAAYTLLVDNRSDLAGLSENQIATAALRAKKAGHEGKWMFGLDNPSIMPFLQAADNRALRSTILNAYLNRGNNNNENDNKAVIAQLVALRLERAQLMGFDNYAAYALDDRMAKTPEAVYNLLDQIWEPALRVANQEAVDIKAMMSRAGVRNFGAHDWRYYSEKVKAQKFNLSDEELMPYFQMEKVRDGIFYVANQLYGVTFTQLFDVPVLNNESTVYECKEADGTHLGLLFLDMFARPGEKNGGAWCSSYRSQRYEGQKRIAPLSTITCNFTRPIGDAPALLTPDEVETFFHEFGHAIHGLFKDVHYNGVSGVPRDFVELPSQIMEHWAFEPEVLKVYAKHYQTGETIPQELVDKLDKAGKYGQGFVTVEYVAASYLDMDYHILKEIPANFDVPTFEAKTLGDRNLLPQIPPRYRTTYFSHTMGGGYTAGYYSYIWAEVLDADAYEAFKETGNIFDPETAKRFRYEVLARGGVEDAMTMYKNFRGKEPGIDALLRNRGLK